MRFWESAWPRRGVILSSPGTCPRPPKSRQTFVGLPDSLAPLLDTGGSIRYPTPTPRHIPTHAMSLKRPPWAGRGAAC